MNLHLLSSRRVLPTMTLVAATLLTACHGRPTIERSSRDDASDTLHPLAPALVAAPGVVEPHSGEVELSPLEPGRIEALLVVEGQLLSEGDLVARLDDSVQRNAVEIARTDVLQATAMLDAMSSTREDLRLADAEMEAAAARAEQALRESERGHFLASSGALSEAESQRWDSASRADVALRGVAEARRDATRRGASRADRRLARARLEGAEARLVAARAALLRREIRAPMGGVVLWSRHHVGEFVTPGQGSMIVLGSIERLEARLEVDELDARFVQIGARCELRGDGGERLGGGRVVRTAAMYGVRGLTTERMTDRTDARVREVFVELDVPTALLPGERVWGYVDRESTVGRQAAR